MAEKLEACPFCGGEAETDRYGPEDAEPEMAINCRGECEGIFVFPDVAASDWAGLAHAWNTRTTPDRSDDALAEDRAFKLGDRVEKISGSSWCGKVVGTYATSLTPEGYAVESEREPGSVQIYPAKALRAALKGDGL